MTRLNGAGPHPGNGLNGYKPPPVTPLRLHPEPPAEPPCDVHSEQALLGALLIANGAYPKVADVLRASHFGQAVHARIYAALGILIQRGEAANPVTLARYFEVDQALAPVGGAGYLTQLADCAVTVSNALDYARAIVDVSHRRELMAAAQELIEASAHPTAETSAADNIVWLRDRIDRSPRIHLLGTPTRIS